MADISLYICIIMYIIIYIYLDLHLALFSAHSSFPLDLRSFWLFTLTWTRKRALVFWPTGIYAFFPGIYAYYPGKYAHNFGFKMHQLQKGQEWCNCARVGENRSKSRNLSNEHLFVLFRGYRYRNDGQQSIVTLVGPRFLWANEFRIHKAEMIVIFGAMKSIRIAM